VNTTLISKRASRNGNGFVRARRFDDFERFFDHFDGVHPDQQFVFNDKDDRTLRYGNHRFATEIIVVSFLRGSQSFIGYRTYLFEPFGVRSIGSDGCGLQNLPEILARRVGSILVASIQSAAPDIV
jgi:hypothetical protein